MDGTEDALGDQNPGRVVTHVALLVALNTADTVPAGHGKRYWLHDPEKGSSLIY